MNEHNADDSLELTLDRPHPHPTDRPTDPLPWDVFAAVDAHPRTREWPAPARFALPIVVAALCSALWAILLVGVGVV